ncbi:NAD(P)/FAD-dependent oxidoreductase [Rivularia sp. UHCC 0363]|uniref:flavin monoamine oxidase family protein n=1 Tax=Rivularia sp. UHCC 0363 TaxID=3110244 RepID=UPI002B216BB4|nr:NAD(P)/FAD-dependent oxidoreductase [Rivularia sp. UHCC 0363]MEA5595629.1 NAD(P)/FAD-dependent oxidoreductase [Rivularia sp. UHCC 0363]
MLTSTLLDMCEMTNLQPGKKITILGAGIAGLVAAYELERLGHQVEIIEGSPRIGGRVWTHRFGKDNNAPYAELGAMRIPSSHQHTLHYVNEMGLSDKLCKFMTVFEEQNAFINLEGKIFKMKDAPRILQQRYQGIFTDTRYSEETRLFAAWLKTIVDTISPGDLRESLENDLKSHLMDELERLDLEPYFCEDKESIDLQSFIKENPSFRARCSKALDMFFEDIVVETSRDLLQLQGGMEQIIDRLVESIKSPIKCNRKVVAIRVNGEYTEIDYVENGEKYTLSCDYVLCTIPFSVIRKMELAGFDERKLNSIHNTYYCPATKVAFHTKENFWQKQGIRGGASFSGEGVRQTYYPSVKFNPNSGSVMLASYTIGDDADRMGMMSEQQRHSYVKDVVGKVHPELQEENMVVEAASIAWGNYEWSAGGCAVHWEDESVNTSNYLEAARRQHQLLFAGEHCSKYPAWLQGSIESALEAVYDIVSDKRRDYFGTTSVNQRQDAYVLQAA